MCLFNTVIRNGLGFPTLIVIIKRRSENFYGHVKSLNNVTFDSIPDYETLLHCN